MERSQPKKKNAPQKNGGENATSTEYWQNVSFFLSL